MKIMTTLEDLRKDSNVKNDLLNGEEHETRRFIITCGQSMGSKNVMFVLYSTAKVFNGYAKDTYLGSLAIDFDQAVINARKKIKYFKIEVALDELCGSRRESCTFPFGKYAGKTAAEVFDIDPKYLFWAANNMRVRSNKLRAELEEYGKLSKILIIKDNREKSNAALPVDAKKVERTMTISFVEERQYWYYHRLFDNKGNLYQYSGEELGEKGDTITLACKVKKSFVNGVGKTINKLGLR